MDPNFSLSEEISKLESTKNLISLIAHPNTLLYAYEQIKSKPGNHTLGCAPKISLDGISMPG